MIEYYLHLNHLTENPDDCIAKPTPIGVLTKDDLIRECSKEGTGITSYEMESMFKRLENVVAENLERGFAINTPIINISPSITGVFKDWDDSFDNERHQLHFKATPGTLLRKSAANAKLQKVDRKKAIIDIYSFNDHTSGTETNKMKPGGIGELKGKRLKHNPTDENQGIFIVAEDGTENRVTVYVTNTDGHQIFQIPEGLQPGTYTLELRTIPYKTKTLQKGNFEKALTIQ